MISTPKRSIDKSTQFICLLSSKTPDTIFNLPTDVLYVLWFMNVDNYYEVYLQRLGFKFWIVIGTLIILYNILDPKWKKQLIFTKEDDIVIVA